MKNKQSILSQIINFTLVGGICFLIDYGLMVLLTEYFSVNYLLSSAISFSVSVTINYILSTRIVFKVASSISRGQSFSVFVILSIIGLGLNELLMLILVEKLDIHYMWAKIISTSIVMVYNFISKKLVLESRGRNISK